MTSRKKQKLTFKDFDKLGLQSFAKNHLLKSIERGDVTQENPIDQGAFTIMLNAKFGCGKSTFLHMFKHMVETEKEYKNKYEVIYINSLESDFHSEPIIAILSELLISFNQEDLSKKIFSGLKEFVNQSVGIGTGFDLKKIISKAQNMDEAIKNFKKRREFIDALNQALDKGFKKDKKLIVLVDELDRARPDYAIRFLEDIKHFFKSEKVTFVFGVNKEQLINTANRLYGEVDANGYLDKFFKLSLDLPDYSTMAKRIVDYLSDKLKPKREKNNQGRYEEGNIYIKDETILFSFKLFKLSLRELNEFFRRLDLIVKKQSGKLLNNTVSDCLIFFLCFYIKERTTFDKVDLEGLKNDHIESFILKINHKYKYENNKKELCIYWLLLTKIYLSMFQNMDQALQSKGWYESLFKKDFEEWISEYKLQTEFYFNSWRGLVTNPNRANVPKYQMVFECIKTLDIVFVENPPFM